MVFVLALGAALANALTSVFQRMGVEEAPACRTLRLSLMTYAVRRGIWLLGFALMIVSFLLQAVALHFGRLSQVQPILTTELVFLVVDPVRLVRVHDRPPRMARRRWRSPAAWPASCTSPTPSTAPYRRRCGSG